MRSAILFVILIAFAAAVGFGQKTKAAPKTAPKTAPKAATKAAPPKTAATAPPVQKKSTSAAATISAAEWTTVNQSMTAEDWDASAALAARLLNRVKTDDEKKRVAQLRYLYLYALAGKILKFAAARNTVEENRVREELIRAAARFSGREFVLPARQFLADCAGVVNYICAVKTGGNKIFRTTATDKTGAAIHSFDYISFDAAIDLKGFAENKTFLGGVLRRVEFNEDLKKPWVMRLIFNKGFARVVV